MSWTDKLVDKVKDENTLTKTASKADDIFWTKKAEVPQEAVAQVLADSLEGYSSMEIIEELLPLIPEQTLKSHVVAILERFGADDSYLPYKQIMQWAKGAS